MKFTVDKRERYCMLTIHEEKLNSVLSPQLKSEFIILNQEGFRNIICDLSEVAFVDSSGLSSLLIGHRLCNDANGTFVLTGCQESTLKLIKISQLDTILNVAPTESEASDIILMTEVQRDIESEDS